MAPPPPKNKVMGCSFGWQPQNSIWKHLRFGKGLRIAWGSGTILPTNGRCATPLPGGWNCRCVAEITRMSLFPTVISTLEYTEVSLFWRGGSGRYPRKKIIYHLQQISNTSPPLQTNKGVYFFQQFCHSTKIHFQLVLIESTPGLWLFSPNFSMESEALIRDVHLSNEKKGPWLSRFFCGMKSYPSYEGIIINHYKDPYQTTRFPSGASSFPSGGHWWDPGSDWSPYHKSSNLWGSWRNWGVLGWEMGLRWNRTFNFFFGGRCLKWYEEWEETG